jgi:hypothetical protein
MPEAFTPNREDITLQKRDALKHVQDLRSQTVDEEIQEGVAALEKSEKWSVQSLNPFNLLKKVRERKQEQVKVRQIVDTELESDEADREVKGPEFALEIADQIADQQELMVDIADAEENEKLLRQIKISAEDIKTSTSKDDLARLKRIRDKRKELADQGITVESLEKNIDDLLDLQIEYQDKVQAGEILSTEAIDTHTAWEKNERIATAIQERVRSFMEDNRDIILSDDDSIEATTKRCKVLEEVLDEVGDAIDRSEDSQMLLRLLAEQVGNKKSGSNRETGALKEQIKEYIATEIQQMYGVEVNYTSEEELLASDKIQRAIEIIASDSGLITEIDGAPVNVDSYIAELQSELGIVVTEMFDSDTEQAIKEYALTNDSILRAQLLNVDSVIALKDAIQRNMEEAENDPDYAIAAAQRAVDLVHSQANASAMESIVNLLSQDVAAKQKADLLAKRNELEKSQELLAKRKENREKRKDKVDQVKQKFTKFINWGARKLSNLVAPEAKISEDEVLYAQQQDELEKLNQLLGDDEDEDFDDISRDGE